MRRLVALVVALTVWPAGVASAHERTVSSGPLRASVETSPWRLAFHDTRGELLREPPETGPALTGTLAYSSGGAWFHATRVLAEQRLGDGAYAATVATTNPIGRITVRIAPDASGVLALTATA